LHARQHSAHPNLLVVGVGNSLAMHGTVLGAVRGESDRFDPRDQRMSGSHVRRAFKNTLSMLLTPRSPARAVRYFFRD
jgi:hypothetical protein